MDERPLYNRENVSKSDTDSMLNLNLFLFFSPLFPPPPLFLSPSLPPSLPPSPTQSTASTTPLMRYELHHPTSLPMHGALPNCNSNGTNGQASTNADNLNTPTPTVQSRLLPTPDSLPTPLSTNHMSMATINEEGVESTNQMPVYAHLGDSVPLPGQQTDSKAVVV